MTPQTCAELAAVPLATAAEQVLETMFFTTIDAVLEEMPKNADELVSAALPFRGSISGVFRLDLPVASARRMAAGFLAEEEESLTPQRIGEAVCELANVICGSALSHLRGDNLFELLTPHLSAGPEPANACGVEQIFQLEDGFLRVCLEVH